MKLYPSLHFSTKSFYNKNTVLILTLFFIYFLLTSCSSTKRIYEKEYFSDDGSLPVRVLVDEKQNSLSIVVKNKVKLFGDSGLIAEVKTGNRLEFSFSEQKIKLTIAGETFNSSNFWIESDSESKLISIDKNTFRGKLRVFSADNEIKIVNELTIEDYVKGVMTREMPVGKGTENYSALKAFSICVRTYALTKIAQKKDSCDLYADTRDQVYGGVVSETEYTNKIVDETAGQILSFNNKPAVVFYHSTCGGFTEDVQNVFSSGYISYLKSIEDGDQPFCRISPRYEWSEQYSESLFVSRLFNSGLIENLKYSVKNISVNSRFESGRVNELEIKLISSNGEEKNISLFSNNIRSVIRTSDGRTILRSTMFDISLDDNKDVIINGKGFGHGVGLCQWGAIGQSKMGIDFMEILNHYFPGTEISLIND